MNTQKHVEGFDPGEICGRNWCKGVIQKHRDDDGCSCHIHPPCSNCVSEYFYCPECDWTSDEE